MKIIHYPAKIKKHNKTKQTKNIHSFCWEREHCVLKIASCCLGGDSISMESYKKLKQWLSLMMLSCNICSQSPRNVYGLSEVLGRVVNHAHVKSPQKTLPKWIEHP